MARLVFLVSCLLNLHILSAHGLRTRYDGYKVYQYTPRSSYQMRVMNNIENVYASRGLVDFWKMAPAPFKNGTFMVAPAVHQRVVSYLRQQHVLLAKTSDNVQRLVDRQLLQNRILRSNLLLADFIREPHTYYMRYAEMVSWMERKARLCLPPLSCVVETIGKSHQQRDLKLIKISNGRNRRKFWIDAGIHPREWIAPSTAMYLIKKLLDYGDEAKRLLNKFEFHILPLMNPDGYEYTHTHSRFWRKNLVQSNFYCTGVDLNRNFGYQWGGTGSSENPCADNYRGLSPFSEPETAAVKRYLQKHHRSILVFITLHSYGQYILTPFGHRKAFYPVNRRQLTNLGHSMAQRIEAFSGRFYDVGSAADLLYEAAGGSSDFASAQLNIPYTYTIELPDTGRYAFFLPPQYIKQVGKEMWIALKEIGLTV